MKKQLIISGLIVLIFGIGFLGYIPIYWTPNFLNELYLHFSFFVHLFCCLGLILIAISTKIVWSYIVLFFYLILILKSSQLREYCNEYIIEHNENKSIDELTCPFVGYKLVFPGNHKYQVTGEAMFVYNDFAMTYKGLVFQIEHNYNMDSFDGDETLRKIYNNNWWGYTHLD